ncbi:MAG: dihydrofolate reductase [Bdellovibrionales bacterium]|nr:dihydrofolate reductase [Bdellovibrionales bacterium]
MTLSLIVAMTEDRVIGKDNRLPWHLPEDLKRFRSITLGRPVIMGRRTFESIGRLLPGRKNIIVSRNPDYRVVGAHVAPSLEAAKELAGEDEVFVIGGARLFQESLPLADKLYLTIIHAPFEGDTFFPDVDWKQDFEVTAREEFPNAPVAHTFLTAIRR